MKKAVSLITTICLLLCHISANEIYTYKENIPIASGITLTKVESFYSDHNISYSYITADLNDENIGLTLLKSGKGMDYSDTNNALTKTEEDVVASLNADFFSHVGSKTIALGIEIKDGKLLQSPINPGTMATIAKIDEEILMTYLDFHIMAVAPNWKYAEIRHLNKHTSYYGDILMFTSDFNDGFSPAPGGEVLEVVVEDGIITEFRRNLPPCKIPENGCVLAVSEGSSMFFANNFKVGDEIKFDYYITPDITSSDIAFGGGAFLVSEGKALKTFSHNISGYNPRSAIGISEDGKTLYLLAVDGRQEKSRGMTMAELASLMVELGCYSAVNLDGGGSTSLLASTPDNINLHAVNSPSETRRIINALGLTYKNAYEKNSPYEIVLKSERDTVFIGDSVNITAQIKDKSLRPTEGTLTWSATGGTITDGVFTASAAGIAKISAECEGIIGNTEIYVVDNISGIDVPESLSLSPGETKTFSLSVFDSVGHYVSVSDLSRFTITSDNPSVISVNGANITAHSEGKALIYVRKDSVVSCISVSSEIEKESVTDDFEVLNGSFSSYPSYVEGSYIIDGKFSMSGEKSGRLEFDFSNESDDSKAAYLTLSSPISLTSHTKEISISAYTESVFSHELRALLTDSEGNDVRIVFAKNLSSNTWHTLTSPLPEKASYPLTLKRIYAVYQKGEPKDSGTLYLDDLSFNFAKGMRFIGAENIYSDPLCKISDGVSFKVGAVTGKSDTLISRLSDSKLKNEINTSPFSHILGENKGFSAVHKNGALFITVNTENGGIRKTSSSQWTSIQKAISESNANTVFVLSDNPVFGSDEFENRVIKDYFSSLEKSVFVIEKGTSDSLSIINGVRYFTLSPFRENVTLASGINTLSCIEFFISENTTYIFKKIF